MINVMVDLETLDTKDSAVILSIGAVLYDRHDIISEFYTAVNFDDQLKRGRTVSGRTVQWWMEQSVDARKVFEELDSAPRLTSALANFAGWYKLADTGTSIWSNGATFDIVILKHAFDMLDVQPPWTYSAERCFRTLKSLYPQVQMEAEPRVEHHALHDARAQALHMQRILECVTTPSSA